MDSYKYINKICSLEKLKKIVIREKQNKKSIVFTNGCFDILHRGHIDYLRKSKQLGDILIIGLNSDDSVSRLKGPSRPINKEMDRAYVLEALEFVDYIIIFYEDTPLHLILELEPDIYTKGGDYNLNNVIGQNLGSEIIENYGGQVVLLSTAHGYSTTTIIKNGGLKIW